jgi:hypothetical protein
MSAGTGRSMMLACLSGGMSMTKTIPRNPHIDMQPAYEQFHGRTYIQTYKDEKSGCVKEVGVDIIPARTKSKEAAVRDFESTGFRLIKVIGESCAVFEKTSE